MQAEPDHEWKVGFGQCIITPDEPVVMGGYANRKGPSEGTISELRAKALAIENAVGGRALLITADFLGFRSEVAEPIYERIMQASGLKRSQIMLNSSHTHTGPSQATPRSLPLLKEEDAEPLVAYTQQLIDQVSEVAIQALDDSRKAGLSYGVGRIDFVMNRREPTPSGIRLGVNPRGPVDRSVPVLKVEGEQGELLGVVFGAACHNTTLTGRHTRFCGDFAGFAQERIERAFPGAIAMFMQGCGGDANPHPRGEIAHALRHGEALADEVMRVVSSEERTRVLGPLRVAGRRLDLPLESVSHSEVEEMRQSASQWQRNAAASLDRALRNGELESSYSAYFSLWQFGDELTLVGLPGEAVYDYTLVAEESLGPYGLWVSAYNHEVFGYLPSARILREGGYEARGLYSGRRFSPNVESVVGAGLKRLGEEVRPKVPASD